MNRFYRRTATAEIWIGILGDSDFELVTHHAEASYASKRSSFISEISTRNTCPSALNYSIQQTIYYRMSPVRFAPLHQNHL